MSKQTESSGIWLFYMYVAILLISLVNLCISAWLFEGKLMLLLIPEMAILVLIMVKTGMLLKKEGAL